MDKKEVLELRRRMKKETCSFDRICGCYVNDRKQKVFSFGENFLNLPEEDFFKFLDVAKKCLGGKLKNNLLDIEFPTAAEEAGEIQDVLLKVKKSGLKDDTLLNLLYDRIIDCYEITGNFVILLYHDIYDVPVKACDGTVLEDESTVYEYMICAVCPVELTKPALGCVPESNAVSSMERGWEVKMPESAFLFPAFNDRAEDIHSALFYTKNTKEPHHEVISTLLSCDADVTTEEELRDEFTDMVGLGLLASGKGTDSLDDAMLEIQSSLNEVLQEHEAAYGETDGQSLEMNKELLTDVLSDTTLSEIEQQEIKNVYEKHMAGREIKVSSLVDEKLLSREALLLENRKLKQEIARLQKELENI